MIQQPIFLLNGFLLAAAMFFAANAKQGSREASLAALGLACNFLFCALAFTDYSPKIALQGMGIAMSNKETWMLADTVLGASCMLLAWRYWWGFTLCFAAMAQVLIHGARISGTMPEAAYTQTLDAVLHAQMAVFFLIGGRGVGDLLHSTLARHRSIRRHHATARVLPEAD